MSEIYASGCSLLICWEVCVFHNFKDFFLNCIEVLDVINFLTVSVVNKIWRKVREKFLFNFLKTLLTPGIVRALSVLHYETERDRSQLNCKRRVKRHFLRIFKCLIQIYRKTFS